MSRASYDIQYSHLRESRLSRVCGRIETRGTTPAVIMSHILCMLAMIATADCIDNKVLSQFHQSSLSFTSLV